LKTIKKLLILFFLTLININLYSNTLPNDAPEIFKAMAAKDYNKINHILKNTQNPCEKMEQKFQTGMAVDFAFNYAIGTSDEKIVKLFLPYVKNITKISCSYSPSITYALINDDTDMIKFLINNGADVNFVNKHYYADTVIIEALLREKIKIAQFLIDNGASLKSEIGFKALQFSVKNLFINNVKFLIQNNVNLNFKDKDGNTILHLMAKGIVENNLHNMQKYLKAKQYIKKFPDTYKKLEQRLKRIKLNFNDYQKIVNLLIINGANINLKNNQGKTPLEIAKENKINVMIKVLNNYK